MRLRQRQRWGWCSYKPRNSKDRQQPSGAGGEAWAHSPSEPPGEPSLRHLDSGLAASQTVRLRLRSISLQMCGMRHGSPLKIKHLSWSQMEGNRDQLLPWSSIATGQHHTGGLVWGNWSHRHPKGGSRRASWSWFVLGNQGPGSSASPLSSRQDAHGGGIYLSTVLSTEVLPVREKNNLKIHHKRKDKFIMVFLYKGH